MATKNKISRPERVLLGYGLHRKYVADDSWFRLQDVNEALHVDDFQPPRPITAGHFTALKERFAENGYIEAISGRPGEVYGGARTESRFIQITNRGEEYLVEGVIYIVRNQGLTVPATLETPEAINAILTHTDFKERLLNVVTGVGYLTVSHQATMSEETN